MLLLAICGKAVKTQQLAKKFCEGVPSGMTILSRVSDSTLIYANADPDPAFFPIADPDLVPDSGVDD
jgi:hypothetical protein